MDHPHVTDSALVKALTAGSEIHGANLRLAAIGHTWEQQRSELAKVLLVNLFAHYEVWAQEICELAGANGEIHKDLQFWERKDKNGKVIGTFTRAMLALNRGTSKALTEAFAGQYKASPRYDPKGAAQYDSTRLQALLTCLRFFKEMRNCLAHNGATIDQKVIDAFGDWNPHRSTSVMGVKEVPRHNVSVLGQPCALDLRGVVGFGEVMLCIVAIVDAELTGSDVGEAEFLRRFKIAIGAKQRVAQSSIASYCQLAGFPKPNAGTELAVLLKSEGLVA